MCLEVGLGTNKLKEIVVDTFLSFDSICLSRELVAKYQEPPSVDCAVDGTELPFSKMGNIVSSSLLRALKTSFSFPALYPSHSP